jgi:hypothetical protein
MSQDFPNGPSLRGSVRSFLVSVRACRCQGSGVLRSDNIGSVARRIARAAGFDLDLRLAVAGSRTPKTDEAFKLELDRLIAEHLIADPGAVLAVARRNLSRSRVERPIHEQGWISVGAHRRAAGAHHHQPAAYERSGVAAPQTDKPVRWGAQPGRTTPSDETGAGGPHQGRSCVVAKHAAEIA